MKQFYNLSRLITPRLLLAGFLVLCLISGSVVFAETQGSTLPPKAQKAMARGLAAAKQQEWELAIKYFGEAQKAAPASPKTLFNLALAYDRAGGRELITIAWYRTYLASAPDAVNAKQVKKRLFDLEIKVEATIGKLFHKAIAAAVRLPEEGYRDGAYSEIAGAQAKAGDIAGAKETAERIIGDSNKSDAYLKIVETQAKAGDIAGAKETAASITDDHNKAWAYYHIGNAQAKAGDIAGARKAAALAKTDMNPSLDSAVYNSIVETQAKAGDIAGAKEIAASITYDGMFKVWAYRTVAQAQAEAGDTAGALNSLTKAKETAARIIGDFNKSQAYSVIAGAQAKAGDIAGAKETAASIKDDDWKSQAYSEIAGAQAKADYIAGAKETAARFTAAEPIVYRINFIVHQLNAPLFADLQGHIRSLTAREPRDMVESLTVAAVKMADALKALREIEAYWQKRRLEKELKAK